MDASAGGGHEEALLDDQRRKRGERLRGRDGIVHGVGGLLFVLVAAVLPFVVDTGRDPHAVTVVALVVALAVASLIEFEIGTGTAIPTQLVLVPMLFALPLGWVPASSRSPRRLRCSRHRPRAWLDPPRIVSCCCTACSW